MDYQREVATSGTHLTAVGTWWLLTLTGMKITLLQSDGIINQVMKSFIVSQSHRRNRTVSKSKLVSVL
jgi:hypothetical protein